MELTDKVAINNLCGWALYFKRENEKNLPRMQLY